jgi:LuxR family maltose regulon positive regulatory protein
MQVPAFELLESKLRPPHRRAGTVPRRRLIDQLERESGAVPVVFISAGPGWGKTTLLTQWAARSQRPFAWFRSMRMTTIRSSC